MSPALDLLFLTVIKMSELLQDPLLQVPYLFVVVLDRDLLLSSHGTSASEPPEPSATVPGRL